MWYHVSCVVMPTERYLFKVVSVMHGYPFLFNVVTNTGLLC